MLEFTKKHANKIVGTLSGLDRVRFRGTQRLLAGVKGLMAWMHDCGDGHLTNFGNFSEQATERLKASVEQVAAAGGRTIKYLASSALSKEDLVQELLAREGISEGLVCVLSCVEPCRTFAIRRDRDTKTIDLTPAYRRCLYWYLYFIDAVLGLCHVRIQSWLPFGVHVCINGREWLCRALTAAGIGFQRRDNCLIDVADCAAAQQLLDAQPWADWSSILNGLLQRACPATLELPFRGGTLYHYWSAEETEWATDVMFRSPQELDALYPFLLHHAMTTFSSHDVLRFLGRCRSPRTDGVHPLFQGEVVSDLRHRPEGVRVKHRLNSNSIKMYDKQGSVLRVETTIIDPGDMKVFRTSEADPTGPKAWRPLRKGVVDLPRRSEISQAANTRYLTALSAVDATTPLGKVVDAVCQPVEWEGRRVRGMNLLVGEDARLAVLMLRGEFALQGFRNRDLRELLFPDITAETAIRRLAGKVTRLMRLFRAHGLIYKIQGTHRYQLSKLGRQTLPAFIAARNASTEQLYKMAA